MIKGQVDIEGNVRVITKDLTLYGSKIDYSSETGNLNLENARIISPDFNIIASSLKKTGEKKFEATQAEFTTCNDCKESWSVYGDHIEVNIGNYVYIKHALVKIKGVSILYLPYIVLPIKNARETGLLFPNFFSRKDEGLSYQQPFFWAINNSTDMTFTPSFWGIRGYGLDYEYRHVFSENSWVEVAARGIDDQIYLPEKDSLKASGENFTRGYTRLEAHHDFSHDTNMHLRMSGIKDADMVGDFPRYFEDELNEESFGVEGFFSQRFDLFNFSFEAEHKKTLFDADALKYNKRYVQVAPSLAFSVTPLSLIQNDNNFFNSLTFSLDSDLTVFKQDELFEPVYIRNFRRLSLSPELNLSVFNNETVNHSLSLTHYYNDYVFEKKEQPYFNKSATYVKNTFSFSVDKVFGLAYKETIRASQLQDDTKALTSNKDSSLLGAIPAFEDSLTQENIVIVKNSYRHAQEFNFIHHYTTNTQENGNEEFLNQISSSSGINDYDDILVEDQGAVGSNISRTAIPLLNTFEFQWNNVLIKKTPKSENYFKDKLYIRDNFQYKKIGYFNLSQGFLLDQKKSGKDKLTRLYLNTGYNASTWKLNIKEFYFHTNSEHLSVVNFEKNFDRISLLSGYNLNSVSDNTLQTIKMGAQYKPIDSLGISYLETRDIELNENIITRFQVDIMPDNNCWILNLSFRDSAVDKQFAFGFIFNFGNESFNDFKTNYFSFNRDGF